MPGHAQDRPRYIDGAVDAETLYRLLLEVTSELSVTRDRLVLLETVLADHGLVNEEKLELVAFRDDVAARLDADRKLLVQRLAAAVPPVDAEPVVDAG
ncbi:hypothetical protein [Nocardioides yefusunii]|uniref:Uncharacterized protein n=1 Tax=Nocardioides yefusunii TaxID=2500546 RepID=A0ABW1QZC5_9ACTN|nr:hypothetical protein [Nocardioides yefusunii]